MVAVATALVGWGVGSFAPSAWKAVRQVAGTETLGVTVLFPEQFDSALETMTTNQYVWPVARADVPAYSSPEEARRLGAVDAGTTLVRLAFRSTFEDRITIQQLDIDVDESPPVRGVWVTGDQGGVVDVRHLRADLDRSQVGWVGADGEAIAPVTTYVDKDAEQNLDLLATARNCDCRWTIRVTYTAGPAKPALLVVTPPGADHFRTSSTNASAISNVSVGTCVEPPTAGPVMCA